MSTKTWCISHIEKSGYTIRKLGRNIEAKNEKEIHRGSINKVHKLIFRY